MLYQALNLIPGNTVTKGLPRPCPLKVSSQWRKQEETSNTTLLF